MTDNEDISIALTMRANHIETGDIKLSANDAIELARAQLHQSTVRRVILPKTLTDEQRKLVARLRKLANKFMKPPYSPIR